MDQIIFDDPTRIAPADAAIVFHWLRRSVRARSRTHKFISLTLEHRITLWVLENGVGRRKSQACWQMNTPEDVLLFKLKWCCG